MEQSDEPDQHQGRGRAGAPAIQITSFEDEGLSEEERAQKMEQKLKLMEEFYDEHLKEKVENPTYYTLEDVAKHNTENDCWTVVEGKVFNITSFIHMHPGGRGKILRAMGNDCTDLFRKFHKGLDVEDTIAVCFFQGFLEGYKPNPEKYKFKPKRSNSPRIKDTDE